MWVAGSLFLSLTACVNAPIKQTSNSHAVMNSAQNLPDWIMNRPVNGEVLYGVGEGRSLSEATQVGLAEIAAGITTSVKSEQNSLRQKINQQSQSSTTIQLNLNTPKFTIDNYQVKETTTFNNRFYSLVSASKQPIIDKQKELFTSDDRPLQASLNELGNKSLLEQIRLLSTHKPSLDKGVERLLVLMTLDPDDQATYQQKMEHSYLNYLSQYANLKSEIVLDLDSQPNVEFLANSLKSHLSDQGYRLGRSNAKLSIQAKETYKYLFSAHNVRLDIQIILHSGEKQLHHKKLTVNGSSVQSRASAIRQANLKAQQQVSSNPSFYLGI